MKKNQRFLNLIIILIMFLVLPLNTLAYSDYIVASGQNIGIRLNSQGVMVVGFYEVNNVNPGNDAKMQIGDVIVKINNKQVESISEMTKLISESNNHEITLEYIRNNQSFQTKLNLVDESGTYKTGLYVKDSITGIGTLTYIDPKTKLFGALGHEIIEKSTGKILEIKQGSIFKSTVTGIEKSERGNPGEKNAIYNNKETEGTIHQNTISGVFGKYDNEIKEDKIYKVAKYGDIKLGEAKILTVISDSIVEEFNINILKLSNSNQKIKNIVFEITDEKLLKSTGGVIQGMSGSPIIQGEYIIGAITHVVVDNPKKGYGIFIVNMLETGEKNQ